MEICVICIKEDPTLPRKGTVEEAYVNPLATRHLMDKIGKGV